MMSYPKKPEFQPIQALRAENVELPATLRFVEKCLPAGHPYKSNDLVTWTHEGTHGVNARMRGQKIDYKLEELDTATGLEADGDISVMVRRLLFPCGYDDLAQKLGSFNAMLCHDQGVCILQEPKVKLSDVAAAVPISLRGMAYDLYLVKQQKYWNEQPLYILDEWSAYTNGTKTAIDLGGSSKYASELQQAIEFCAYASVLLGVVLNKEDNQPLRDFVAWQFDQVSELFWQSGKGLRTAEQEAYWEKLAGNDSLKRLTQLVCGQTWWADVVENSAWGGIF